MEEEIKKRVHEKVHSQAEEIFKQQRKVRMSNRATILLYLLIISSYSVQDYEEKIKELEEKIERKRAEVSQ